MGNGKIWLDGQLKPVSALPSSSDFLGWTGPAGSWGRDAGDGAGASNRHTGISFGYHGPATGNRTA